MVLAAEVLERSGCQEAERGAFDLAIHHFRAAVNIEATPSRYDFLAQCLLEEGQDSEALAAAKAASALDAQVW